MGVGYTFIVNDWCTFPLLLIFGITTNTCYTHCCTVDGMSFFFQQTILYSQFFHQPTACVHACLSLPLSVSHSVPPSPSASLKFIMWNNSNMTHNVSTFWFTRFNINVIAKCVRYPIAKKANIQRVRIHRPLFSLSLSVSISHLKFPFCNFLKIVTFKLHGTQ